MADVLHFKAITFCGIFIQISLKFVYGGTTEDDTASV